MVDCYTVLDTAYGRDPLGGYGTHEISYGSQRSNIDPDIIGYNVPEQHIGRGLIETWDTNRKRGGEWTCRDLCEVGTTGPPTVKNIVSPAGWLCATIVTKFWRFFLHSLSCELQFNP